MRKISFIKTIKVVAEVPDNFFDEDGIVPDWNLIQWVNQNEGGYIDNGEGVGYNQWQSGEGKIEEIRVFPKDMEYCQDKDAEKVYNEKDIDNILEAIYDAEACYECGGYGDDYDTDGNSNCPGCPHNKDYDDDYDDERR